MAVHRSTSFGSAFNAVGGSTPTRLSKIEAYLNTAATATSFLCLFDTASVNLGVTTPSDCVELPLPANASAGYKMKHVVIFPNGGKRFATALSYAVVTTFNGSTGATTHAPTAVNVFFEIGN